MKIYSGFLLIAMTILFGSDQTPKPVLKKIRKEARTASYFEARAQYEIEMLKDPATGKIPKGIFLQEVEFARTLPIRNINSNGIDNNQRTLLQNTYLHAGPNNIGGRTRALAYDVRFGSSNQVIIAGCVSGGTMRSADGGNTWTLVTPPNEIHNLTAIVQDPRPGFQDNWYAGGGEFSGNSASQNGAPYLGYGIWKSTDNGMNWNKLTSNITDLNGSTIGQGQLELFDHPFDFVHRMVMNPVNGHLYIAGHRRLVRSTDGGNSFHVVFGSNAAANSENGQMDVAVTNTGRVYLAVNGGIPDQNARGVWVSTSGNINTFSRIAGGQTPGIDSIPGWRGNSYTGRSKRILITLAPSDHNIAYVFYENGLSSDPPELKPEADLFRMDAGLTGFTWSNRSANMPDFPAGNLIGSDPLSVQGGYDMMVRVKPDDPNTVFIGGTNLYRSTNGFSSTAATSWIGGYNINFTWQQYPKSHADIHELVFNPVNANQAICGNDGGIQFTQNILAANVTWSFPLNYQTLQYYYVAIDPDADRNNFAGGSQDNGVRLRDRMGILGTVPADSNNHRLIFSADGTSVGISKFDHTSQNQYVYGGYQLGNIFRFRMTNSQQLDNIRPNDLTTNSLYGSGHGEFVTNFRLNYQNTEDLYYVNFNRLFRTSAASSVTAGGWTELTGVGAYIGLGSVNNPNSIRGMAFTWGNYNSTHSMFIGTTNGRLLRIDDPRHINPGLNPVDITPSNLVGNIQDIAINPNNDNEIMAVVSNYGISVGGQLQNIVNIWWTNNAKSNSPTWRNAEGNLGGTATSGFISGRSCAIIVKRDAANNPVTEYYVGTGAGLYSVENLGTILTANGSPVWQREAVNTLNLSVIQSMAYRPADNVLLIGTHGNGMFYAYTGTPNYTPNNGTGIDPITNDRNFIRNVYPTISSGNINYQIGNMFSVKKITIIMTDLKGRTVMKKESGYTNGNLDIGRFANGMYILSIYSNDRKYRHIQKVLKK